MISEEQITAVKSVYERTYIADKAAFSLRVQMMARRTKRHTRVKRLVLSIAVAIVPLLGVAYAADRYLTTSSYQQLTIQEGLKKVNFRVYQPSNLPFKTEQSWSDLISVKSHRNVGISLIYVNGNKALVETVTTKLSNGEYGVIQQPQGARTIDMGNGLRAFYSDEQGEIIWKRAGNVYSLQDAEGTKTRKPFLTVSQLVTVARSIK